ncbi:MAG: hypothetical protein QM765_46385 [Myxococcales bacterium]
MRHCLLLAALLALPACKDECNPSTDKPHCQGSAVVYCAEPGVDQQVNAVNRWYSRDCLKGQSCVEDSDKALALCALSGQTDPSCAADATSACESATSFVYCDHGYATARYACRSCSTEAGCVGGPSSRCTTKSDCASDYVCGTGGYCQLP